MLQLLSLFQVTVSSVTTVVSLLSDCIKCDSVFSPFQETVSSVTAGVSLPGGMYQMF